MINEVYDSGEIPEDLGKSIFITLPKKPDDTVLLADSGGIIIIILCSCLVLHYLRKVRGTKAQGERERAALIRVPCITPVVLTDIPKYAPKLYSHTACITQVAPE